MSYSGAILICLGLVFVMPTPSAQAQVDSPIPPDAELELLASGFSFGEGPVWHPDGFLLFSDVTADRVIKLDPETRAVEVFLEPSGEANGLALDADQNLIMCRRMARDVASLDSTGAVTILATDFEGTPFNGPNDLTVRADGTIFFTDPDFRGDPSRIDAVYALLPSGKVHMLENTLEHSNGITMSPDEQTLYVVAASMRLIFSYTIENDSTLSNKQLFASVPEALYLDGMKVDANGLLYVAGGGGVWIFSPEGILVDHLEIEGTTTNVSFGGADQQKLYITEQHTVYRIQIDTQDPVASDVEAVALPDHSDALLFPSYPNPFHSRTVIPYQIRSATEVVITIYNQQGQVVRVLEAASRRPSRYQVVWDGQDANGHMVASGLYWYTLRAGTTVATRSMVFVR